MFTFKHVAEGDGLLKTCHMKLFCNIFEQIYRRNMANFRTLTVLWMACVFSSIALAQEKSIDSIEFTHPFDELEQGWWNISLHGGFSFLTADVDPEVFKGSGVGVSLGRNLFYEKNALLVTDFRLRFQYGIAQGLSTEAFEGIQNNTALNGSRLNTDGLNYDRDPGFIYQNYRSSILQTAFEIPIYFNPARMNNRLHFGVFAGLGLGWYHADIDQLNASGLAYDYANDEAFDLDDLSNAAARDALNDAWDREFETNADGFDEEFLKFTIMPSFGAELGVIADNNIVVGLGHRFSLTRTDLLDGSQWNPNNTESEDMDFLHFSHIFVKWNIPVKQKKSVPPSISKLSPEVNEVNTREPLAVIRAKLDNVKSVNDITILHNGLPHNVIQYYQKELASNVPLVEGINEILITVSNNDGTDQELFIFNYIPSNRSSGRKEKAEISFVNPAVDGQTIAGIALPMEAQIVGIKSDQEVRLFLNQQEIKDFKYDIVSAKLSSNLTLRPGENEIKILALNKNGISQALRKFTADTSGAVVNIDVLQPAEPELTTTNKQLNLRFFVSGTDSDKVRLIVNGVQTDLNYNEADPVFTESIDLEQGTNIIKILAGEGSAAVEEKIVIRRMARKEAGEESAPTKDTEDQLFVIEEYITPVWMAEEGSCSYNMELSYPASVDSKDIELSLNNTDVTRFRIFEENRLIRSVLQLEPGRNLIKVRDLDSNAPVYDKVIVCEGEGEDENENENENEIEVEVEVEVEVEGEDEGEVEGQQPSETLREEVAETPIEDPVDTPMLGDAPVINILSPADQDSEILVPEVDLKAKLAHVGKKENITLYFNDKIVPNFDFDPNDGTLEASLNPKADENQITLIAINDFGVADEVRYINYKQIPPPEISIIMPQNQERFSTEEILLKANVSGATQSGIRLVMNDNQQEDWVFEEGELTALLKLKEGVNRIELTAQNRTAHRSKTIYINYSALRAPEVMIISPEKDTRVIAGKLPLVANVKHVDDPNQISVVLNGNKITEFSYTSGTISKDLKLREGTNSLKISAINPQGEASDERRIEYHIPKPPEIMAVRPITDRVRTKINPYPMDLSVKHIYDRSQIKLKLNGRVLTDYLLDSLNSKINIDLLLKEGVNEIVVEAQNEDGGDARSLLVEYISPQPPAIALIQPQGDLNTESAQLDFSANVSNIRSSENVQLFLNGQKRSFELKNTILTSVIQLREGKNEILLTASNEDGTEETSVIVQYTKPLPPPVIELIQPKESGIIVEKSGYDLSAELLHIKGSYTIMLSLNGIEVPFDFTPVSGKLMSRLELKEGSNEIDLKVKNSTGTAKSQMTINFRKPEDPREKRPQIELLQLSEIKSSSNDASRGTASIVLQVKKVDSQNQLSLTVNEQEITNFVFDPQTGKLITPLTLQKGLNVLELIATNPFGTEAFSKEIEF